MKWESSDLTVGAVVVAAAILLLGSFFWLSPAMAGRTYPVYTEFDQIDGINTQSNVVLRGYTVGTVGGIEPYVTGDGSLRFRVQLDIQARLASGDSLRLPGGTRARLVPPPVIGAGFIVLETPDPPQGRLSPGATIPGVRNVALLDQVQGITTDVSGEVLVTMGTARQLMDSVSAAVSVASRTLTRTASLIPPIIESLEAQLVATRTLTDEVQTELGTLSPAARGTIDSVALLLGDSRRLVSELETTLLTTRPELFEIVANLDTTALLLSNFTRQVTRRPWKALTGVEPPPGLVPPEPGPPIPAGSSGDTMPRVPGDSTPDSGR